MGKKPSFMFYPKDWQTDAIFGCSLAARGLWLEMMNVMHGCEPYGYLTENGKPMTDERIARRCGTTLQEYVSLLSELDAAGIPRRTKLGVIYSKRMIEDEQQRKEWRNRQNKHRVTNRDVTQVSQQSHGVLHSSFPYPLKEREEKKEQTAAPPALVPVGLWLEFVEMRKKIRKPMTPRAVELIHRELQKLKDSGEDVVAVIEQSIRNCWQDVFPVRKEKDGTRQSSKERDRAEHSQKAIENAFGHRSRLADTLRANLPGRDHGGTGGALPGSLEGHPAGAIAPSLPASSKVIEVSAHARRSTGSGGD